MELALALGVVRAAVDVLTIMGDATLAVSAIVLGASMFQRRGPAPAAAAIAAAGASQTGALWNTAPSLSQR
jgi:hypothetical protein